MSIGKNKSAIILSKSDKLLKMFNFALEEKYKFKTIRTGQDALLALRMIDNQEFNFIIVDYDLVKMNGLVLIQRLNKLNATKDSTILFLSNQLDTIQTEFCKRLRIDHICEMNGDDQNAIDALGFLIDIIPWTKKFETGIKSIDKEHKELYKLIHLIRLNDLSSKEVIQDIFAKLEHHCDHHFKDEEEQMQKLNYHYLEQHKKQHKILVNNFQKLKKSIITSDLPAKSLQDRVYLLALNWFNEHLQKQDMPFIQILKKLEKKEIA